MTAFEPSMPYVAARGKGNDIHTALKIQGLNWRFQLRLDFKGNRIWVHPPLAHYPGWKQNVCKGATCPFEDGPCC